MCRCRYSDIIKNLNKGTGLKPDLIPRPKSHQYQHSAHIENQYAIYNLVNGTRNCLFGILRLTGSYTDKLNSAEGEHHRHNGNHHTPHTIWKKTAICPKIAKIIRKWSHISENQVCPQHYHKNDSGYFDESHPKFNFTVGTDRDKIYQSDNHEADEGTDPLRQIRQPVGNIDTDGTKLRHTDENIQKPIIPAGEKAWKLTPILRRIIAERA